MTAQNLLQFVESGLGVIPVSGGGTGVSNLTGYVRGSGSNPLTASSKIPGSDIIGNISGNASNVTGVVALANGGTGTSTGSINGSGSLVFTAGGTNTNVTLAPNGTGTVDVSSKRITSLAAPTQNTDAATKAYVDSAVGSVPVGNGAVWTGQATFGNIKTTGSLMVGDEAYAYMNDTPPANGGGPTGKLLATVEYVDKTAALSGGLILHAPDADCATIAPIVAGNPYDFLQGMANVKVAMDAPPGTSGSFAVFDLTGLPVIQGVQLAPGDRVLILGRVDAAKKGIWTIPAEATSTTPWVRAARSEDLPTWFPHGVRIFVTHGTYANHTFEVAGNPLRPTNDATAPFSALNFAVYKTSAPSGVPTNPQFKRIVRAKGDTYEIVGGKVVIDGVVLEQNDRFIWSPNSPDAGIYRIDYSLATLENPNASLVRVGDLNNDLKFIEANNTKVLVREGATNARTIFTISVGSQFGLGVSTATFGSPSPFVGVAGVLAGTPVIDGYATNAEERDSNGQLTKPGSIILVKNEADARTNGLYYIPYPSGGFTSTNVPWIRHPSADQNGELVYRSYVRVKYGNTNKNAGFKQSTNVTPLVIGSDPLVFAAPTDDDRYYTQVEVDTLLEAKLDIAKTNLLGSQTLYVDGKRTDTYTADGTILRPFKTIQAAHDFAVTAYPFTDPLAAWFQRPVVIRINAGDYAETLTVTRPNTHFVGAGGAKTRDVVIHGRVVLNITTNPGGTRDNNLVSFSNLIVIGNWNTTATIFTAGGTASYQLFLAHMHLSNPTGYEGSDACKTFEVTNTSAEGIKIEIREMLLGQDYSPLLAMDFNNVSVADIDQLSAISLGTVLDLKTSYAIIGNSRFETTSTSSAVPVIRATSSFAGSPATLVLGNSLLSNRNTNGDGIYIGAGAVANVGQVAFNIGTVLGTGFAVNGVAGATLISAANTFGVLPVSPFATNNKVATAITNASLGTSLTRNNVPLDTRTPTAHVLATASGLGGEHTVSGLTSGQVLKAKSATTAQFEAVAFSEVTGVLAPTQGGTGVTSISDLSTSLGLGTMAQQNQNNVTITGGTISINGLFNVGLSLSSNSFSTAKISACSPLTNFKAVGEVSIFTVPNGHMFLVDTMEIVTTSITGPADAPIVRFGVSGSPDFFYPATRSTSNSFGERHVVENPQNGVDAGLVVTFGITEASTASDHQGVAVVTGYLLKKT